MINATKIPVTKAIGEESGNRINKSNNKRNTAFLAVLGKFSNVAIRVDCLVFPKKIPFSKIITMKSNFLPEVNIQDIVNATESGDDEKLYDLLVQPLHEELYKRQTFDFLDELSWGQQLLLATDYVRMQAGQGGFIQLIQNGYISLLPNLVEQLQKLGVPQMAQVLDDALKVYVLNREILDKPTTVEEFAHLYNELKEFEQIDKRFLQLIEPTTKQMLLYSLSHLDEFIKTEE
jgi:hypothetical protein